MTLAIALDNDKVEFWGYNKEGDHYSATADPNADHWEIAKMEELDKDDTIIDLASGTHFTLFVTKNGHLYGTGKSFLSIIGMENSGSFKKIELPKDHEAKRVWVSKAKKNFLAIIEMHNKSNNETYLVSIGQVSEAGLLGLGTDDTKITDF